MQLKKFWQKKDKDETNIRAQTLVQELMTFLEGLKPDDLHFLYIPALLKRRQQRLTEIEGELPRVETELKRLHQLRDEARKLAKGAARQVTVGRNEKGEKDDKAS